MAVDRASGFRPSFISAEELSALQPRTSTVRGLPIRDDDVYDVRDPRALDDSSHEVLPAGADDDQGGTQEQAPVETYLVWLNKLAVLARAAKPDIKSMLAAADELYIPRHTALQDIFDVLGITAAGEEDPQIQDWMSMLLRNGGDLDLDTLSNVLDMLRTLADPERKRGKTSRRFEERVLAEIQALKDQLSQALASLDSMQERTSSAIAGVAGQIDFVTNQMHAWENYRTELQGFCLEVQAAAERDGFDAAELNAIVVAMEALRAPGEADNFVSRADWLAATAGIVNTRELTLAEQTIAAGQLAGQLLERETAGELTIDPRTRDDIVAAHEAGEAATAGEGTATTADTATPSNSV